MRFFNYIIIATLLSVGYNSASAKRPILITKYVIVEKVVDNTTLADNAIFYNLPKTAFEVVVEAEKTIKKRGPFYRYSERYLGLKDVIINDEISYQLKSITLKPYGVTDANKWYKIAYKGDVAAPYIMLDNQGKLLAVNTTTELPQHNISIPASTDITLTDTSFAYTPFTEDQLIVSSTAKMAEECASSIYDLRRSRTEIISGNAPLLPTDGKAYELSLKELGRLEHDFLALFMGKTAKQTIYSSFRFVPKGEMNNETLFRFSKFAGMVDKSDISGEPVYITLKKQPQPVLKIAEPQSTTMPAPVAGLAYNMPAVADITLTYRTKSVLTQTTSIAQLGSVATLPVTLLEQSHPSVVLFPETGAIKSIKK